MNSDEQREQDAAVIAEMRVLVEAELPYINSGAQPHSGLRYVVPFAKMESAFNAALREIDGLREESRKRAQMAITLANDLKYLKRAIEGVPEMLEDAALLAEDNGWPTDEREAAIYRAKAAEIRKALKEDKS